MSVQASQAKFIDKRNQVTLSYLQKTFPNKQVFACDFPVVDIPLEYFKSYGLEWDFCVNIDHHHNIPEMRQHISSTNFAMDYVKIKGLPSKDAVIGYNHTDCDSILACYILEGIIPTEEQFGLAAICADHTGQENEIADLLQPFKGRTNIYDAKKDLLAMLEGKPISSGAQKGIDQRRRERDAAQKIMQNSLFHENIAYVSVDHNPSAAFYSILVPEAVAIVIEFPGDVTGKKNMRVRLGQKAPRDIHLCELNIPDLKGRWNAGSTHRTGGTTISVDMYARMVHKALNP